mmetsp:Transcript_14796/g.22171  ORF Transcript_14796/g.22171 Transcript_14796/m.22171 type:complete len:201 (-) Transcript_14796:164-766(-)
MSLPFYATSILILLINAISPSSAAVDYDKNVCLQCIENEEQDCTYCRGSDFFDNASICVCEPFSGFFGDCNDHSFGATPYETKRECEYDNENADTYFIVLVTVLPVLGVLICCCCIGGICGIGGVCMCLQNRRNTYGSGPSTTGAPNLNETQPEPPIAQSAPAPSAPPMTYPTHHTHEEAEITISANTGPSTFDSLAHGI